MEVMIPVPALSLQERQALKCLAAFFTLSPFALRNLSTQALLQNFSCQLIVTYQRDWYIVIPKEIDEDQAQQMISL